MLVASTIAVDTDPVTATPPKPPPDAPLDPDSVQAALKQRRPFRSRRQETFLCLLLTAEATRWPLLDLLAGHDELTPQQYNVLRILRGAGADGLPTLEIGTRMIERTPGVTRLIDRMEKKALVTRQRDRGDRRQVICRITERGLALLKKLDKPIDGLEDAAMAGLSDAEVETLLPLLNKVRLQLTQGRDRG
jgi:DNA-binding MarR family transcriptional regulator